MGVEAVKSTFTPEEQELREMLYQIEEAEGSLVRGTERFKTLQERIAFTERVHAQAGALRAALLQPSFWGESLEGFRDRFKAQLTEFKKGALAREVARKNYDTQVAGMRDLLTHMRDFQPGEKEPEGGGFATPCGLVGALAGAGTSTAAMGIRVLGRAAAGGVTGAVIGLTVEGIAAGITALLKKK